jgi:hypothetical protein
MAGQSWRSLFEVDGQAGEHRVVLNDELKDLLTVADAGLKSCLTSPRLGFVSVWVRPRIRSVQLRVH